MARTLDPKEDIKFEHYSHHAIKVMGVRIRRTLRAIDPLNEVPCKRATSRVQKRSLLRGPPNTTSEVKCMRSQHNSS